MRSRAYYRKQHYRIKKQVESWWWWYWNSPNPEEEAKYHKLSKEQELGIFTRTHKLCNSMCCANPRKWGEQTRQERRSDVSMVEQYNELFAA